MSLMCGHGLGSDGGAPDETVYRTQPGSWSPLFVGLALAVGLCGPAGAKETTQEAQREAQQEAACGVDLPMSVRGLAKAASDSSAVVVAFVPDPAPWAVGRHVGLRGVLCGPGRLLRVDADMPAHRHGMNYRPTLQVQADGRFTAQGLMLHMPGRWRIRFEVESGGRQQWLDHTLEVK